MSCAEGCGEGWGHAVSCDARALMRGLQVSGAFSNATRLHALAERMLYCWGTCRTHAVYMLYYWSVRQHHTLQALAAPCRALQACCASRAPCARPCLGQRQVAAPPIPPSPCACACTFLWTLFVSSDIIHDQQSATALFARLASSHARPPSSTPTESNHCQCDIDNLSLSLSLSTNHAHPSSCTPSGSVGRGAQGQ